MRLAIATDNGQVSAHFGHCPHFTLVDIDDGTVVSTTLVDAPEHAPGRIPRFLKDHGSDVIIAGGMGPKAMQIFDSLGIQQIIGVTGAVEKVVAGCLDGTLAGGESLCSHGSGEGPHHGSRHGDHGHDGG
jgi:predicted Fe-Mo cluster-binding NifX family protein